MARTRYIVPFVAMMALMAGPEVVRALKIDYCANINTGTTPTNSSIYQSDGLCHDFCVKKKNALAVVQGHNCWCGDYIPFEAAQVDIGKCNNICPGFPSDTCGGDGLYGYMLLDVQPAGTIDPGSSTIPTPTAQTSTTVDTSSTSASIVRTTTTSTSTASSTTVPDSTTETTTTSPPTPSESVKTVTLDGTVSRQTVTVTPIPLPSAGSDAAAPAVTSTDHKLSAGAAAGIAIGVLAIVAILLGIAIFVCLKRRKRQREEELGSRPPSHLSGSMGMMSTPTTAMASVWDGENTSTGRRSSRLMPHDPRMDPFATNIYTRFENKSRESINTLQDNQDYSRKVLRTTNPDPPE